MMMNRKELHETAKILVKASLISLTVTVQNGYNTLVHNPC